MGAVKQVVTLSIKNAAGDTLTFEFDPEDPAATVTVSLECPDDGRLLGEFNGAELQELWDAYAERPA